MLKFQRNRTKPELIKIFLVTSIHRFTQQGKRRSPMATEKHEQSIERHFGPKMIIEWEHLFRTFLRLFMQKMTSAGYKRERNKKHSATCEEPIFIHIVAG